jgi:LPPG:FO 2-phospho-L-lactate transferase
LAHGFTQIVAPGDLTVIVNVADDFEHWGLYISPDIDSVLYTLADVVDRERGWGVAGDTSTAMGMAQRLGADTWFHLGDADLATHVRRTDLLRTGSTLTDATASMARSLGITAHILPVTDQPVRTVVETNGGDLAFQRYFVERQQQDRVRGFRFAGIDEARPTLAVMEALRDADLVVIGPSNPLVSVAPLLGVLGMRESVRGALAVSPIVAGRALKGPADRMLADLGHEVSALGVARLYQGLVKTFVLDETDAALLPAVEALGMRAVALPTIMRTDADRAELARELVGLSSTE